MSPYNPSDAFTPPDIYDLSDLVKGGDDGDANVPLKALADQTFYLKNRLPRWEGITVFTDSHEFDIAADIRKLLVFQITENKTLVLPQVGLLPPGTRVPIQTIIPAIKALTVEASEPIIDGSNQLVKWDDPTQPATYMHDAEKLILVAAADHWLVESAEGNFSNYGESFGDRKQRHNTIIGNGTIYNRADIPRVTLYALSLGPGIVEDAAWLGSPDPVPYFKGCYSSGNGSTTIRVPDERGLSDKYLDMGRGLDTSRISNTGGVFQDEQVGPHDHATHGKGGIAQGAIKWFLSILNGRYSGGGGSDSFGGKQTSPDTTMRTSDNVGTRNVVKNIGKIPLIRL